MIFIAIVCTVLGGFLGAAFVRRANQVWRDSDDKGSNVYRVKVWIFR